MAQTTPPQVLAHFQRLQEDIAINQDGPCGALRGISNAEYLAGFDIPADGYYEISSRDDIDTVVVSGRLADLLRILSNAHLKAPHFTGVTIPRASKLEPLYYEPTR